MTPSEIRRGGARIAFAFIVCVWGAAIAARLGWEVGGQLWSAWVGALEAAR